MIIVSITVGHKTYTERIPDKYTRIRREPEKYQNVRFTFHNRRSLEKYREHFIYGYLENAYRSMDLPDFVLCAREMVITVTREEE